MEYRWNSEWNKPTAIGVVSFGVGAAVGYYIAHRKNTLARNILENIREFAEDVDEGINEALDEEEQQEQLPFSDSPAEWTTSRVVQEVEEVEVIVLEEDNEVELADFRAVTRSAFPPDTPEWDYEVEIAARTSEAPYIIHVDEHFHNESGYIQRTITYYRGDEILVDEQDVPLYDWKKIVGDNLKFGKGSNDPSIVYIRNDKLEAEFEVILDTGYYQVEVLGAELEHSFETRKEPLHRFRD